MSQTTKKALAASLKKLLNTTPLRKITVNDIVNDCGVNRRTFYYHFQDIFTLWEWMFRNEVSSVLPKDRTYQTWQQVYLQLFLYLNENRKMVLNSYNSIERSDLETHLYNSAYNLIFDIVNEVAADMKVSEEQKKFVVDFYKLFFAGLVIKWIGTNMVENPQQIIENLDKIISGDIHKALLKCEILS